MKFNDSEYVIQTYALIQKIASLSRSCRGFKYENLHPFQISIAWSYITTHIQTISL